MSRFVAQPKKLFALLICGAVVATSCREASVVASCRCAENEVCIADACRRRCEDSRVCDVTDACYLPGQYCAPFSEAACRDETRPACYAGLAPHLLAHACQHANLGPFRNINAEPMGSSVAPTIQTPQVVYRVALPQTESEVSYSPTRPGEHAILYSGAAVLRVLLGNDSVPVTHDEPALNKRCSRLSGVRGVRLEVGKRYRFLFSADGPREVSLFVEHLESFNQPFVEICPASL